tara:strand:+ start:65 stop:211 length:147 start_codon:yes stop_codon:yes gene_type:complete
VARIEWEIKDLEAAEYLHSKWMFEDVDLYDLAKRIYDRRTMEGKNWNE